MSKATGNEAGRQQTFAAGEDVLREVRDELMVRIRVTMLNFVKQLFDEEREALIGEKWSRKREGQAHSGGTERGSIYLEGRRLPVKYPRIADADGSHGLSAYRALRLYDLMSESGGSGCSARSGAWNSISDSGAQRGAREQTPNEVASGFCPRMARTASR